MHYSVTAVSKLEQHCTLDLSTSRTIEPSLYINNHVPSRKMDQKCSSLLRLAGKWAKVLASGRGPGCLRPKPGTNGDCQICVGYSLGKVKFWPEGLHSGGHRLFMRSAAIIKALIIHKKR